MFKIERVVYNFSVQNLTKVRNLGQLLLLYLDFTRL
jgi:hypothetical protein